jgi:hypothetical protein
MEFCGILGNLHIRWIHRYIRLDGTARFIGTVVILTGLGLDLRGINPGTFRAQPSLVRQQQRGHPNGRERNSYH